MESDNNNYFRYNTANEQIYTIPKKLWKWVEYRIDYGTGIVTVDGVDYTPAVAKTQLHNQIRLFGLVNDHMSNVAIADFKAYVNDELYLDFEAKEGVGGSGYFHDKIHNVDYYSATATPLVYYEESVPKPIALTDKTLIYQMVAGNRWESFPNPYGTTKTGKHIIVEIEKTEYYNMTKDILVPLDPLPDRGAGGSSDVYLTFDMVYLPSSLDAALNIATADSGANIYISVAANLPADTPIRIYSVDEEA